MGRVTEQGHKRRQDGRQTERGDKMKGRLKEQPRKRD